jgi:hypothetical protein
MREDARSRGRRLLAEGRLVIRRVDRIEILALCRGDSGELPSSPIPDDGVSRSSRCSAMWSLDVRRWPVWSGTAENFETWDRCKR